MSRLYQIIIVGALICAMSNASFSQDSLNVTIIGSFDTAWDWAYDVPHSGEYAYMATGITGIRIVYVSNTDTLFEVGIYDTPGEALALKIDSFYAYVADGEGFFRIADITNPENPFEVGFVELENTHAYGVFVSSSYAYVACGGLQIIDIS